MGIRNVIVGTDWWTDSDDVFAMRILARQHKAGVICLRGVVLNACREESAASLDAFLISEGLRGLPIGLDREGIDFGRREKMYQPNLAKYPHDRENKDCENPVKLYRRLLATSEEKVELIEIGYPQVLAKLLQSEGDEYSPLNGLELVKEKVSKLWMMAGNWENDRGFENNFTRNARSRQGGSYVCANWPTEITFLGWEAGNTVITGTKLSHDDIAWQAMADIGCAEGRSSWDPMLCLMACIGNEEKAGYSVVRGIASCNAETGENFFQRDESGKHCFVVKTREDTFYSQMIDEIIG